MLKNTYLIAKIGADTAANERNFAKNCQIPSGASAAAGPGASEAAASLGASEAPTWSGEYWVL